MKMKAANWSVTGELEHAGILPPAHARLFDGAEVQAEMLHTRVQSINMPQACNGPVAIDGRSAGRDQRLRQRQYAKFFGAIHVELFTSHASGNQT